MALTRKVDGVDVPFTPEEEQEFLAEQAAATAEMEAEETANTNLRNQFKAILLSCVGVRGDQLTNTQVRALALYSAHKQLGCMDISNFTIKPLNEWVT